MTATSEFAAFIASLGFNAPDPDRIVPGTWSRFSTNGRASDDAGSAKIFPDLRDGIVMDHRSGESWTWHAERDRAQTDSERKAQRARIEAAKAEARAKHERDARNAAEKASAIWKGARAADESHPYLKLKGVGAHGLRVYRGPLVLNRLECNGTLIVPAMDSSGAIASLSFIGPAGEKRYMAGPRPAGCRFLIGEPADAVCIAEGYATAAAIHEATGHAVFIAFDAGNLEAAARQLREQHPAATLIICADDDVDTEGNPGRTKASAAARAVGALIAVPDFGMNRPHGATDFNDLARHAGAEAVQRCVSEARAPRDAGAPPPAENRPEPPQKPRATPKEARSSAPSAEPFPMDRVEIICANQVKPEAVDWLWPGYLAAGKVHIMAGAPGTGKTTLALGLAAALTSGGRWPDATHALAGGVLIWSGEDGIADTLVPRLTAAGAALDRVHFVGDTTTPEGLRGFDPANDFAALEVDAARITDLKLVIIDPIVSAVERDSNKGSDVRRGLQPLVRFAERMGCAVLGISHFSKGTAGKDPVERVTGSIAFGALARVVLATAKVPQEEGGGRIMVRAKSNLGPDGGGFRYDLRVVSLEPQLPGISAIRPEWLGPIEGEARELLAAVEVQADPEERSASSEAADLLRGILGEGRVQVREAHRALKQEGFTDKQIRRARETLGIVREREGFNGTDYWALPPQGQERHSCPDSSIPAPVRERGINGQERTDLASQPVATGDAEIL